MSGKMWKRSGSAILGTREYRKRFFYVKDHAICYECTTLRGIVEKKIPFEAIRDVHVTDESELKFEVETVHKRYKFITPTVEELDAWVALCDASISFHLFCR